MHKQPQIFNKHIYIGTNCVMVIMLAASRGKHNLSVMPDQSKMWYGDAIPIKTPVIFGTVNTHTVQTYYVHKHMTVLMAFSFI